MKKRTKRILAMLLASAMILQQGSTVGVLATETEPVSETVAETTAAETMTQETQAPETTAETKAPETQATETVLGTTQTETAATEQTETAAPQTEQTETPAATEATEATETAAETTGSTEQSETTSQETTAQETTETPAQTEEKTEAAEETATEKATEAATETEAPKTNFTYEDGRVIITAVAEAAANLPQDAQIHADYMAPGTAAYNEAAAALEAAYAGQDVVLDYVFYDIYFTAASAGDGRIEPEAGTVTVSMQFKKAELTPDKDVEVQSYDVVHVENGKAQEVPSTVQTTGDGSVASVGFTSDSFSPYGFVTVGQEPVKTIGADVPMVIDAIQTGDPVALESLGTVEITLDTYQPDGGFSRQGTLDFELNFNIDNAKVNEAKNAKYWEFDISALFKAGIFGDILSGTDGATGTMSDGTVHAANYRIDVANQKLIIEAVPSWLEAKDQDIHGGFHLHCKLDEKKIQQKTEVELKFPGSSNVNIEFEKPKIESWKTIDKTGSNNVNTGDCGDVSFGFDAEGNRVKRVTYTVKTKTNTALESLVLEDILGEGQQIVGDIEVNCGNAGIWGKEITPSATEGTFKVDMREALGIDAGDLLPSGEYEVKYTVELKESAWDTNVTNKSQWTWNGTNPPLENETSFVPRKDTSRKTVTKELTSSTVQGDGVTVNEYEFTYTITIGDGETNLNGYTIEDIIDLTYQEVDFDSVEIKQGDTVYATVTVNEAAKAAGAAGDTQLFTYTFANDVKGPYTITYKTKLKDGLEASSFDVKNNLKTEKPDKPEENHSTSEHVDHKMSPAVQNPSIEKEAAGLDTENNLVWWEIRVNVPAGKTIENPIIKEKECWHDIHDYGPTKYKMEIDWSKVTVTYQDSTTETVPWHRIEGTDNIQIDTTLNGRGVVIKLPSIYDFGNGSSYFYNKVGIEARDLYLDDVSAHQEYKADFEVQKWTGNYSDGELEWTVEVNGEKKEYPEEVIGYIVDTIPEGMTYVEGSISITRDNSAWDIGVEQKAEWNPETRKLKVQLGSLNHYSWQVKYKTKLDEDLVFDTREFTNSVRLFDDSDKLLGGASASKELKRELVEKKGTFVPSDKITYTIEVNKEGLDLSDDDTITLTDKIPDEVMLYQQDGDWVRFSVTGCTFKYRDNVLTITVPDETPLTVTYTVIVKDVGFYSSITNSVTLRGIVTKTTEAKVDNVSVTHDGWIAGASNALTITKYDETMSNLLSGAIFTVYKVTYDSGTKKLGSSEESVGTLTTDSNGKGELGGLSAGTLYSWKETTPPSGYENSENKDHYFMLYSEEGEYNKSKVSTLAGEISKANGDIAIDVSSGAAEIVTDKKSEEKGSLKLKKTTTGLDGVADAPTSYKFTVQGPNGASTYYDKDGPSEDKKTVTVPATGEITIEDLPLGTYTITELSEGTAVPGYDLTVTSDGTEESATGTAELETNGETVEYAVTNAYTDISVSLEVKGTKKVDDKVPAKEFTFYMKAVTSPSNPSSDPLAEQTIDATNNTMDGEFKFAPLKFTEEGTYKYEVWEGVTTESGILIDDTVYTVTVTVTKNSKTGKLEAVATQETKEESADSILFNNTSTKNATLAFSGVKTVNGENATGNRFKFKLTPQTSGDTNGVKETNNNNQTFSFGLTYPSAGEYVYKLEEETYDQNGYTSDSTVYYITITVDGTPLAAKITKVTKNSTTGENLIATGGSFTPSLLTFDNKYTETGKAELKIQKTYSGNTDVIPEGGFSFILEAKSSGAPMPKDITGTSAEVKVTKEELKAAGGKAVVKSFDEIEYTTNGDFEYTIREVVPEGADEDGIKDGILYDTHVYNVKVSVTDGKTKNGQKTIKISYTVDKETKAYDENVTTVTVDFANAAEEIGSLKLSAKKIMMPEGVSAKGYKFELKQDGKVLDTKYSDESGTVTFKEITYDFDDLDTKEPLVYTVSEAKGNNATIVYDDTVYTVTVTFEKETKGGVTKFTPSAKITKNGETVSKMEFLNKTTVKVDKIDEAGNKLSGAKLQITEKDAKTGTPIDSWTTGSATHDVTGKLEVGKTYVLEETDVPAGYAVAPQVEFTIDADGNVLVAGKKVAGNLIQMTDAKLHFNVNKTELGTGDEVEGAELTVYEKQADGTLKKVEGASWTSKKGETHDFGEKLEAGKTYVLREEVAPDGYGYVTDIEFTVEKDGKVTTTMPKTKDAAGNDTYLVEDARIRLEVDKRATGTGEELDGAVLELLDAAGNVVESWTSKKGETHNFGGKLKAGESYTLRETIAPDGYTCVTDMKFTVGKDGTVNGLDSIKTTDANGNTVYVVEDTLNKVSIQKVDESGAALAGAKLVIKDADGKAVSSWTTGGKAHEITGLAAGKYTLSEVEAPEGYQVSKDVPFEITGKEAVGSVIELSMTDTKIPNSNKYSLTVTKHLHLDGITGDLAAKEATYYVALFSDEAKTQRVSNVKKIEFRNATSSTVTFDKLAAGTYYVGETDENGTLLVSKIVNDKLIFHPEYTDGGKVELEGKKTEGTAEFTNVYMELPSGFYLSGQITVTKKVLVNGAEGTSDETYYARVFSDKKLSTPASDVLALDLAGGTSASVTVTDLPIGESIDSSMNYYVAETDENGKPLDPDAVTEFEISIDKSEVVLSANNSAQEVVITNNFVEEETETETETETEVEKKEAPKTSDDTDFMRYLLLMALSAGTCAIAFEEKRRRNRARK